MRFIGILACIGLGAVSVAGADAPNPPAAPAAALTPAAPATPTSTATAPAPTTSAAPVKAAAPAETLASSGDDERERHFLAEGYKLEMRNGEKVFCRREEVLGSRLGAQKVCSSALQLTETERQARDSVSRSMMQQNNPGGH